MALKVEELGFEASVAQSGGEKSLPPAMRTCCDEKKAGISEKETVTVLPKNGDHNELMQSLSEVAFMPSGSVAFHGRSSTVRAPVMRRGALRG